MLVVKAVQAKVGVDETAVVPRADTSVSLLSATLAEGGFFGFGFFLGVFDLVCSFSAC